MSDVNGAQIWLKNISEDRFGLHVVLAHELGHQIVMSTSRVSMPIEWQQRYDNATRFHYRFVVRGSHDGYKDSDRSLCLRSHRTILQLMHGYRRKQRVRMRLWHKTTGMVMLGAAGGNRFWRSTVEMLPKPIADWVFHVLDVAKAVMDATSANAWFSLSDFNRSKEFRTSLTEFRRNVG